MDPCVDHFVLYLRVLEDAFLGDALQAGPFE